MIRLLGGVLILLACAGLGYAGAARLSRNRQRLAALQQGLLALAREIDYSLTPLAAALTAAAQAGGAAGELFREAAARLSQGDGISGGEAWLLALQSVEAAERELLSPLAAGLGLSAVEEQLKQVELCRLRLQQAEQAARDKEMQFGKLWRSMGWATGLLLVLLLA